MKKVAFLRAALLCLSVCLVSTLSAQNVGINDDNTAPDPNAMLDVKSTTKGVLFPRLTTAQRTTLGTASPTEGMLVFDTDVEAYFFFTNGSWAQLTTGGGGSVPPGTILAYGDDTPPAGYLSCDGSLVDMNTYPALFNAIGVNWGGDGLPNFRLPDLRGRFPRGWDEGAGVDPNAVGRTALHTGGATGDNVGSYQEDEIKSHWHVVAPQVAASDAGGGYVVSGAPIASQIGFSTEPAGGDESRPKNAYVHYIIKY